MSLDLYGMRHVSMTARRRLTQQELTHLARRAEKDGPHSHAALMFEKALDEVEAEKQCDIHRELAKIDHAEDEHVDLNAIQKLIRCTVALTLEECEAPDPQAKSDDMEWRIAAACSLISLLVRIEDFRHDFLLDRDPEARLSMLDDLFRDQMRKQRIRLGNRDRLDMILPNVFKRFVEEFSAARRLERDLRQHIKHYDMRADLRYETRRFDQPIAVAFASALALEVHFEARVFDDDVATQGAR